MFIYGVTSITAGDDLSMQTQGNAFNRFSFKTYASRQKKKIV